MNKIIPFCIILFISIFGFSCKQNCKNPNTDKIVSDYVNYFKTLDTLQNTVVVKIRLDSSISNIIAYRIRASANLLYEDEIPNKIERQYGINVAYFTKNIFDKNEKEKQISYLKKKKLYQTDEEAWGSNYPEWVLLQKNKDSCFELIKNTHNYDLKEIIDGKYKN